MAYFLINKTTESTIIAIDKIKVAELLKVHRHTITNRFKKVNKIETDDYIIYRANKYYPKETSGGNRYTMQEREERKEEKLIKQQQLYKEY